MILTAVPPASGPAAGLTLETIGPAVYVNSSSDVPVDDDDVPPGVVTVTVPMPTPFGDVAVIRLSELIVNDWAAVDPKSTAVAPVNPAPAIVTVLPPASGPAPGLMPKTVGTGS